MATLGPVLCGEGYTGSNGDGQDWTDPGNLATAGSSYAQNVQPSSGDCLTAVARITLDGGDPTGSNLTLPAEPWAVGSEETVTYGGAADTGGLSLTPAGLKAATFGLFLAVWNDGGTVSGYAVAADFDLSALPDDATIDGVAFTADRFQDVSDGYAHLNNVRATVYYTPAAVAPVAAFSGTPLSGTAPLAVAFTDASTNTPASWLWEKNDGGGWANFASGHTTQNPTETFAAGTWAVRLTATNAGGSDAEEKAGYVTASSPPPPPPPPPAVGGSHRGVRVGVGIGL